MYFTYRSTIYELYIELAFLFILLHWLIYIVLLNVKNSLRVHVYFTYRSTIYELYIELAFSVYFTSLANLHGLGTKLSVFMYQRGVISSLFNMVSRIFLTLFIEWPRVPTNQLILPMSYLVSLKTNLWNKDSTYLTHIYAKEPEYACNLHLCALVWSHFNFFLLFFYIFLLLFFFFFSCGLRSNPTRYIDFILFSSYFHIIFHRPWFNLISSRRLKISVLKAHKN